MHSNCQKHLERTLRKQELHTREPNANSASCSTARAPGQSRVQEGKERPLSEAAVADDPCITANTMTT